MTSPHTGNAQACLGWVFAVLFVLVLLVGLLALAKAQERGDDS